MKQLIAGVVIIIVLGFGAFLYRNTMERPGESHQTACTLEAKLCPDGSSVGRSGPTCAFAACAHPNVEVPERGIAFVIPEGYTADENAYGAEPTLIAAFIKPSLSIDPPHSIVIRSIPIPEGKTAEDVMIEHTRYQPADLPADDMSDFAIETINGRTFYSTVLERFEAQVHSVYYFPRATDVLRFEVVERDVVDWMEPTLAIKKLPEHAALGEILRTLLVTETP